MIYNKRVMTNTLITSTKNTTFEEIFNFLTYESTSTRMKCLNITPCSTTKNGNPVSALSFSGIRVISYPHLTMLARRFVENFPDEIEIKVKGYVDETGHAQITTALPEIYQRFVFGKENIEFCSNGNIKVSLKYHIVPSSEEGFLGNIKNVAYNNMTSSMESYFIDLYQEKRKACFNTESLVKINDMRDLETHLKSKKLT